MDLITAKEITKIWKMDKIKIPKTIFIIHQKKLFDSINEKLNLKKNKFIRGEMYIDEKNEFGIITKVGLGYSPMLMLAEELSVYDIENVIAIGIGGYINNDEKIKTGDTFLIDKMYSQVDLSSLYKQKKEYLKSSEILNKRILEKINLKNKNSISVISLYKESEELVENSLKNNISVIEMETFPLALVFKNKKINFSQIVGISDILEKDQWSFDSNNFKIVFESLEKVFLKIVEND